MEDIDPRDVEDLVAMLDAVPWDAFPPATAPRPTTGPLQLADVLADGRLLLVRSPKTARIDPDDVRRLLVALALARLGHGPNVREVGVYLARHGHLWSAPVEAVVAHEAWPQVESWLDKLVKREERIARSIAEAEEAAARGEPAPPPIGRQKPPKWVKQKWRAPAGAPPTTQGKAEQKKKNKPAAGPAKTPRKARPPGEPPAQDAPKRTPRPDWRRGSPLRRRYGK